MPDQLRDAFVLLVLLLGWWGAAVVRDLWRARHPTRPRLRLIPGGKN